MAPLPPPPPGILKLSNELLRDILDQIEADPDKLVNLDRRAYLSQESFRPSPPPSPSQASDIANFRLTCHRFAELGAIHQFARVTTRFSRRGFRRLEVIAVQRHLAKHVKKFSYMVPYFYVEGRERVKDILQTFDDSLGTFDVRNFDRKAREQKELVKSGEDARVLRKAIKAFTSLQHVQILRVQDTEDEFLLRHLRQHHELARFVELKWAPACSHSTKTIGEALLDARSPCSRFSSPMLSPQSAEVLAGTAPTQDFRSLFQRLTSLEVHFDDGIDLENKMTQLSGLFKAVLTAAENMQAIHVGFPSHRPLNLPLEDLFHNVRWRNLSAFGIQAWKLHADEIVGLARRHREKLRGLRLRDVQLKDGSRWKDILAFLRDGMPYLDWVSLRRIGYAKHFDEQRIVGAEVPDDPPGGGSSSDDESDNESFPAPQSATDSGTDDDSDDHGSEAPSDDEGPHTHEMDFPRLPPETPSTPWCNCNGRASHSLSAEELGDNGVFVGNVQRKMWEKWVVKKCLEHGKR